MALQESDTISLAGAKALLAEKRSPVSEAASVMGKAAAAKRAESVQQPVIKDRPAFQAPPVDTPEDEEDPDNQVQAGVDDGADELPEVEEEAQDQTGDEPTIEIDGEILTAKEIRESYLRRSDYTRKTQETSQRADSLAQKEQFLVQRETQGLTKINDLIAQAEALAGPPPNWGQLAQQYDPQQVLTAKFQYDEQQQKLVSLKAEKAKLEEQQLFQSKALMFQDLVANYKPEWRDQTKLQNAVQGMANFAVSVGLPAHYLAAANHPALIKLLDMAFELHTMKESHNLVNKKVRNLPKPLKPGASRGRNDQASSTLEQARKTWESRSNPSTKDALTWINAKKDYETRTGRKAS